MAVQATVEGGEGRMVYVDPPAPSVPPGRPIPEPRPDLQEDRWRFRFPWVKTAVAAPTYNGELVIVNRTDRVWQMWHNYHGLGLIDPGSRRSVKLVRAGTLSVRQLTSNGDNEYILLVLTPELAGAEIVDLSGGEGVFELRPLDAMSIPQWELPNSLSIEEMGLSERTVNALKRIGVDTAGELKTADLGALWEVRNGPSAYAELIQLLHAW